MTAKVISVFNQKGGSGKTTMSMHIAGTLGRRGYKTLVVDLDPQGTASRWYASGDGDETFKGNVISLVNVTSKLGKAILPHTESFDVIVIDCPPAIESAAPSSAMLVSDLAIIPIVPAPVDIWAAQAAKQLALNVQGMREDLEIRFLPNMVQQQTKIARDVIEVLTEDNQVKTLQTVIGSRSAYRECQVIGGTVHNIPGASKAVKEIENLVNEISDIINLK